MFVLNEHDANIIGGGDFGHYREQSKVVHRGIDLAKKTFSPGTVLAPVDGTVVAARRNPAFHPWVVVVRPDSQPIPGRVIYHIFGHLSKNVLVKEGDRVLRGQPLGQYAGRDEIRSDAKKYRDANPEMSPHVHWEIASVEPSQPWGVLPRIQYDPATWWAKNEYVTKRALPRAELLQPHWMAAGAAVAVLGGLLAGMAGMLV